MILLTNIYCDVLRSVYTAIGGTDVPEPFLTGVEGHLTRVKDAMLMPMQASALYGEYEIYVEPDIDIRKGDIITNIIRKDNGLPWFVQSDLETWRVLQSTISSPGFGEYRDVNIARYIGGGPSQRI